MPDDLPLRSIAVWSGLGFVGSVLSVLCTDSPSWREMALSVACGVVLAATATPAIISFLDVDPNDYSLLVALLVGVAGRRVIVRLASEPIGALREVLTKW